MADDAGRAAAYRKAADYLAKAAEHSDPYRAFIRVVGAVDTWPEALEGHPAEQAILHLYDEQQWEDNTTGLRWLAQAARLRLLVEAWHLGRGDLAQPQVIAYDLLDGWLREVDADGR